MSRISHCGRSGGKLAIVSIDLAGYSRLMEEDEQGTHRALMTCRHETLEPIVSRHDGRIIKSTGDGALITFPTADDAVSGMIAFQKRVTSHEAAFPESRRLVFRAGIHLSEAIYEEGDLYGHGVNLAVRLQEAAEPGSIYLSDAVVEKLQDENSLFLSHLGKRTFKNLSKPISIYRWQGFTKRYRPSASWQLAALAATTLFFVSTPPEPGKMQIWNGIDDRQLVRLNRTEGQRLEMAAWPANGQRTASSHGDMVEAVTNGLKSNLARNEEFDLLDPITHVSEAQIARKIASIVATNAKAKQHTSITFSDTAKDAYVQAWMHYARNSPQGLRWAVNDLNKVIELDPNYNQAHALLAASYWTIWQNHWQKDLRLTASEVLSLARKHLSVVDGSNVMAHVVASEMLLASGRHLDALAEADRAIVIDPTAASGYYAKGLALIFDGQPSEGKELILTAIQKNPYTPKFLFGLALSQFNAGRFRAALSTLSHASERNAENDWVFLLLGATYGHLGQREEATKALEHFKKLGKVRRGWVENYLPYLHTWPFRKEKDWLRIREGLQKADDSAPFSLALH